MLNTRIRVATDQDMGHIKSWLEQQKNIGSVDSLFVNWSITEKQHIKGSVRVYVDPLDDRPIAYFWGTLNSTSSIIEVKDTHRHKGIAREIVEFLTNQSAIAIEPLLLVDCAPASSEGFWKNLKFNIIDDDGRIYAKQKLHIKQSQPDLGERLSVKIRFFDDDGKFHGAPALSSYEIGATRTFDHLALLDQVVAEYAPDSLGHFGSLFVEIYIGDSEKPIYFDKCKYEKAKAIGIQECENGYLIQALKLEA